MSFTFYYRFNPSPGLRIWSLDSFNRWREQYPDGADSIFDKVRRGSVSGCPGSIATQSSEPNFHVFVPDLGCPRRILERVGENGKYKITLARGSPRTHAVWHDGTSMDIRTITAACRHYARQGLLPVTQCEGHSPAFDIGRSVTGSPRYRCTAESKRRYGGRRRSSFPRRTVSPASGTNTLCPPAAQRR